MDREQEVLFNGDVIRIEGGTNNVRLYFSSPFNIEFLGDYIFSAYKKAETSMQLYFEQVNGVKNAEHVIEPMTYLSDDELQRLLEQAKSKRYDEISENILHEFRKRFGIDTGTILK